MCKIPIIKQYITVSGVNQEIPLGDSGIPKFPGSRIAVVQSGKKKNGQFVCLHKRKNRFLYRTANFTFLIKKDIDILVKSGILSSRNLSYR